jgi:hypothetical protein
MAGSASFVTFKDDPFILPNPATGARQLVIDDLIPALDGLDSNTTQSWRLTCKAADLLV